MPETREVNTGYLIYITHYRSRLYSWRVNENFSNSTHFSAVEFTKGDTLIAASDYEENVNSPMKEISIFKVPRGETSVAHQHWLRNSRGRVYCPISSITTTITITITMYNVFAVRNQFEIHRI